jgi:hypothetical protein
MQMMRQPLAFRNIVIYWLISTQRSFGYCQVRISGSALLALMKRPYRNVTWVEVLA